MRTRLGEIREQKQTASEMRAAAGENVFFPPSLSLSLSLSLVHPRSRATRLIRRGFRIPNRSRSEMTEVTHHIFRERFAGRAVSHSESI